MGTVHIIICNPKGKKRLYMNLSLLLVNGWEVSGDTDVK